MSNAPMVSRAQKDAMPGGGGSEGAAPPAAAPPPTDPLMDIRELLELLPAAIAEDRPTDAFLLSAGALQVAEDAVQGSSWGARRIQDHLEGAVERVALRGALAASRRGLDGWTEAALRASSARRGLASWCARAAELTESLAALAIGAAEGRERSELLHQSRHLARELRELPGAARLLVCQTLRQPSCFRSFDLHPADAVELVRRFADRYPQRDRPLLVIGVRTSGSYLAPLAGAALRQLGYGAVTVGTSRPPGALLPGRTETVRRIRRAGGAVLLLDDPPVTGSALAAVADRAERDGFPTEAVIPLIPVFSDGGELPRKLSGYPCVVLPGQDWEVRDRLREKALSDAVAAVLPTGRRVVGVEVGGQGALSRWAHLSVPLDVRVAGDAEGPGAEPTALALVAEWAGVGHLGRRAVELAQALPGFVPAALGFADGVLLRHRLPSEPGPTATPSPGDAPGSKPAAEPLPAATVARYVAERQESLAVGTDRSQRLAGRQPVWEVAARVLEPAFGRLGAFARPLLLDPGARRLLSAPRPCLVDGRSDAALWFADGAGGWAKTCYAEGAFSNLDLASYDPLFDLAGAALRAEDGGAALIDAYRRLTGSPVPPARWCLLTLVQGWNAVRLSGSGALPPSAAGEARRAQARAAQRFLADVYLRDLPDDGAPSGPWVVLDVDGVLETDVLGFPVSSPRGMLALRALRAHGYRTLLATGRSLPEVRDRCTAYGLVGGVAEYGGVGYLSEPLTPGSDGEVSTHLEGSSDARNTRAALRELAGSVDGVCLDPLYQSCIRASVGSGGRRSGLPQESVARLLSDPAVRGRFTAVPGDAQTDFVPLGVDKVRGTRQLLARLGQPRAVPALAVGDGVADIELLRWARLGLAPGNAEAVLRASGATPLRRSYQSGLAEAVGRLIGHQPGCCPRCRAPEPDAESRLLLAVLAVPEGGRAAAAGRIARLATVAASAAVAAGRGR